MSPSTPAVSVPPGADPAPPGRPGPGRPGLRAAVQRRPLLWFFALATALSWAAWTPYVLSRNGLGVLDLRFPPLLGSSQVLGVLPGAYLGPITAAFAVTALADGRPGLRRWAGRLARWRVDWRWYAGVLLGVPGALALTTLLVSGGPVRAPSAAVLGAYLPALLFQLLTTGIAEEPGWRDFALPRLQPRFGPLAGTLVLGPLWGAWHLPLFLSEWGGWPDVAWWQPPEFILGATTLSMVMTWVFNRTGESLPLAMLLHVSVNNFFSLAAPAMFPSYDFLHRAAHVQLIASGAVAAVLLIATRGRLGWAGEPTRSMDAAAVRALLWWALALAAAANVAGNILLGGGPRLLCGAVTGAAVLASGAVLHRRRRADH